MTFQLLIDQCIRDWNNEENNRNVYIYLYIHTSVDVMYMHNYVSMCVYNKRHKERLSSMTVYIYNVKEIY